MKAKQIGKNNMKKLKVQIIADDSEYKGMNGFVEGVNSLIVAVFIPEQNKIETFDQSDLFAIGYEEV